MESSQNKDPTLPMKIRGLLYSGLWYYSIFAGFYFLYAPTLPLLFLHRRLYRRITDLLFCAWESFNVSLLEIVFGVKTFVTGDFIRPYENSVIILNHRTRLDWNFFWNALMHHTFPPDHNAKLVLKDDVKQVPGTGWIMQMSRFIYISRNWKTDEERMSVMLEYLEKHATSNPFQLILFPEGTNLTPSTLRKSHKFGEQNNLPKLKNVLLPRTTGFSFIADKLIKDKCLDAVYDVTIAYPDEVPLTETDILNGKLPDEVHFHIVRHGSDRVPKTLIGLEKWLHEIWQAKDERIARFFETETKSFFPSNKRPPRPFALQYVSLFAWFSFMFWSLTSLSMAKLIWICLVTGVMFVISKYSNGLQEMEAKLDNGSFVSLFKKDKKKEEDEDSHSKMD